MGNRTRPWNKRKPIPSPNSNTQTAANDSKGEAGREKPPIPPSQPQEKHWDADEREHHRIERRYWYLTALLTFVAVLGAIGTTVLSKLSLDESQRAVAEAIKATSEAHRQADAAEKQIRISVRPWVGLTDDSNPIETTPLRFAENGDVRIDYKIITKNFSTAAVQSIDPFAQLVISENMASILAEREAACETNFIGGNTNGAVSFAGKIQPGVMSASLVPKKDISVSQDGKTQAWLVGCIGYRDQFNFLYKTSFIYNYVDPAKNHGQRFILAANSQVNGVFVDRWFDKIE
jgi:hypothetical protein